MADSDRTASSDELATLRKRYDEVRERGLALDLTRGKPASEQLELSSELDGILGGDYRAGDGTDTRNYGGLDGLAGARELGSLFLDCAPEDVMVGGNSSLTLMFQWLLVGMHDVLPGADRSWKDDAAAEGAPVRFLCPVPGYDRHFTLCEHFGIEMLPVPMDAQGPDMDAVEAAVASDPAIKGIWCVPRYSNPTGVTYSERVVDRFAALGKKAGAGFRILWDNAYALHHLETPGDPLVPLLERARAAGCEDTPLCLASTSKVTFAGAGVAFTAASAANRDLLRRWLSVLTIGPDKVNQLRHVRMFADRARLEAHMARHAELLRPKFAAVEEILSRDLGGDDLATWSRPRGGYFVSLDTRPGLAREVVRLASEAGVKLTPAGATFPYGRDPEDRNIRIAPTFPPLAELRTAMEVVTLCVRLASLEADAGGR